MFRTNYPLTLLYVALIILVCECHSKFAANTDAFFQGPKMRLSHWILSLTALVL